MRYETIWTFRTARFTVELGAQPETDVDLSWADAETLADLESGRLANVCFRVRVLADGMELAAEYLGNSVYAHVAEFRDHFGRRTTGHGSYFTDMVRAAVAGARGRLKTLPTLNDRARR